MVISSDLLFAGKQIRNADGPSRGAPTNVGILTVMIVKAVHAMFRRLGRLAGLTCAGWLVACAPTPQPLLVDEGEPVHTIYVFSNGWHTSIVLSRDALPPGPIPEAADFPEAAFLEFGWGDREYYPSPRPTMGMALAAALTPTPAVLRSYEFPFSFNA